MNKMNLIRKLTATFLLALFALQLSAQERKDTTYVFRFVPNRDMFYVPYGGNDKELARLAACINTYRNKILGGGIPLRVDGYCDSKESKAANIAVAKTRSNRVKSELIARQKLTEECFVTRNRSGGGNYVTVRLVVPIPVEKGTPDSMQAKADSIAAERVKSEQAEKAHFTAEEERLAAERAEQERRATEEATRKAELERAEAERLATEKAGIDDYTLSLRANLLRWATLTPDLGIETPHGAFW